jgi:hypothetical protein
MSDAAQPEDRLEEQRLVRVLVLIQVIRQTMSHRRHAAPRKNSEPRKQQM